MRGREEMEGDGVGKKGGERVKGVFEPREFGLRYFVAEQPVCLMLLTRIAAATP